MNESYFNAIQQACPPGVWSKAIVLSRSGQLLLDKRDEDEIILRILLRDRPVHPRVSLWPNDEDWYCDCGDRNDPCVHIAAAAIALRSGLLNDPAQPNQPDQETKPRAPGGLRIAYRFLVENDSLLLTRHLIRSGETPSPENLLRESLVSRVGGIQSGRISSDSIAATQDDFAVDRLLGPSPPGSGVLVGRELMPRLLTALESATLLSLVLPEPEQERKIQASGKAFSAKLRVEDFGQGFRSRLVEEKDPTRRFRNGAALYNDALRPSRQWDFSRDELSFAQGRDFSSSEAGRFVSEILPTLERRIPVEIATVRLPRLVQEKPSIALRLEKTPEGDLVAVASIVYGDPPIARLNGPNGSNEKTLELLKPGVFPERDFAEERALQRALQSELHLALGELARFRGEEAIEFATRATRFRAQGSALSSFLPHASVIPGLDLDRKEFFFTPPGANSRGERVSFESAYRAWRENRPYVPFSDGQGWASVPAEWIDRYGERLASFLEAREAARAMSGTPREDPEYLLPELAELCQEAGIAAGEISPALRGLRETLETLEKIPPVRLPDDLRAELRSYQRKGADWLAFLRAHKLGALLADDMGLGKTLQALSIFEKGSRALVIAPTSVLASWEEQAGKFRPGLQFSLYYGPDRKLDPKADLTLTSYGLLRLDRERLASEKWHTIVLDEAQTIKNPESQVARAAHSLRSDFKIALTGTPIENRLDDLWSQFQFLNPGLLGSLERFRERASDAQALEWLRKRIRPFILRRLKAEVAPELPPRTELVLNCELSQDEQSLYSAILASTRAEIVSKLEEASSGSVLQALEALLRLRQACCHPALIPGSASAGSATASSSKLELLVETLEESIALGHRALVFSQWTSLLDLIEPALRKRGIGFTRLDGSTRDRAEVVSLFQSNSGPPVMLISLKAGGVGLTLTRADHVFIMDPWWNPAVEDQASDRAHRIGQEQPVFIYRLVAKDTVEERILALQNRKRELAKGVLEAGPGGAELTREELLALLQ